MPRSGPESRFRGRLTKDLKLVYPISYHRVFVDAYRSGTKPCDLIWFNRSLPVMIELKAKPTLKECFKSVSENQKSSLRMLAGINIYTLLICEAKVVGKVYCYQVLPDAWGFKEEFILIRRKIEGKTRYDVEKIWARTKKYYRRKLKWILPIIKKNSVRKST